MKNPKDTTNYTGKVDDKQFAAWQSQHGEIKEIHLETPGETLVFYLKPPQREHYADGLALINQSKDLQVGEMLIRNLWLGGDERCKPDSGADIKITAGAALIAKGILLVYGGYLKN
ncbi:MAG: hypothetical protein F9K23_00695 [Bacteroidetes bacterium]|nr:MAG: hypothetical protein F9K23_00695 [Bacteroidota bacterium]